MKDPAIQLWCEDEVHFQRHSSLIRMWAPKGQQPRVLSPSVRHKVGFFGALNLKTGVLLTQEAPPLSIPRPLAILSVIYSNLLMGKYTLFWTMPNGTERRFWKVSSSPIKTASYESSFQHIHPNSIPWNESGELLVGR